MISEKQIEQLCERLVNRIEQANLVFLEEIGKSIKKIGSLTPSKAQQLVQILKYGTSYNDIIYKISQITGLNLQDVDEIFHSFAEKDRQFYKQFYEYRNIPFTSYLQNDTLVTQVQALANITKNELSNFMNTRALGYSIKELDGHTVFMNLNETYNKVLDEAILNVGQGKITFDEAMRNTLKQLGDSGLKTLDYQGRSVRLDSAVRMHMQGALRNLHNETQKIYGQEFGANGVEISVHSNPAPDHAEIQGRQFSYEEYEKLQSGFEAKTYEGRSVQIGHSKKGSYRPISEYNCYHYEFSIVLGVSEPQYNDQQLKNIINENNKPIEIDGKKYTKYECTQLQRTLERKIREQKDIQILAKASGNDNLILESQQKITQLTNKYREISKKSGLPTKANRLRVSGYRRTKVNNKNISLESTKNSLSKFNDYSLTEKSIKKYKINNIWDYYENIGKNKFNFQTNEALNNYTLHPKYYRKKISNDEYRLNAYLKEAEEIKKVQVETKEPIKLYRNTEKNSDFPEIISTSLDKQSSKMYMKTGRQSEIDNSEIIELFVEKGTPIASTYNVINDKYTEEHSYFRNQKEIILIKENIDIIKIEDKKYLIRKKK